MLFIPQVSALAQPLKNRRSRADLYRGVRYYHRRSWQKIIAMT